MIRVQKVGTGFAIWLDSDQQGVPNVLIKVFESLDNLMIYIESVLRGPDGGVLIDVNEDKLK